MKKIKKENLLILNEELRNFVACFHCDENEREI